MTPGPIIILGVWQKARNSRKMQWCGTTEGPLICTRPICLCLSSRDNIPCLGLGGFGTIELGVDSFAMIYSHNSLDFGTNRQRKFDMIEEGKQRDYCPIPRAWRSPKAFPKYQRNKSWLVGENNLVKLWGRGLKQLTFTIMQLASKKRHRVLAG